jgi:protein-S-isoprenylcysteine O-methyltransferase Ste14
MTAAPGDSPGVIAMPPFILLAFIAAGLIINFIHPLTLFHGAPRYLSGVLLLVVSGVIVLAAHLEMRKAGTNVDVRKPVTVIVKGGIYRYTRNPMYLSMVILLVALSLLLNNLWILVLTPFFIGVMQKGVIEREETYLEKKFGSTYVEYKKTVRRWI